MGQLRYHYDAQYIDGGWKQSTSDKQLEVVNPATEDAIGSVPAGTAEDMTSAVAAARRAFDEGPWPRMAGKERSREQRSTPDALVDDSARFRGRSALERDGWRRAGGDVLCDLSSGNPRRRKFPAAEIS